MIVRYHFHNGYRGCDQEEVMFYENDTPACEIDQDCQQKWIPVVERLPEELREVLTYSDFRGSNGFEDCEYQIAYLYNGKFTILNRPECVTHWMSLPQPPKEGE